MQAYMFAHRVFPRWFFEDPAAVAQVLSGPEALPHLIALWKEVGMACQESLASDGLALEPVRLDDWKGALIRLPPPSEVPEAHFLCLVWPADKGPTAARILTLEHSLDLQGEKRTVLGEWRSDGAHLNFGSGPEAQSGPFLQAVRRILGKG